MSGKAFVPGKDFSDLALVWVMVAFLLLAIQSALLSPAEMGVVKELVGSERLGFANGVMEETKNSLAS